MWISKKKYNELVAQKDDFERIASNAVAQNGRILDAWHETLVEMKDIQELNHCLQERNEELLAHIERLEQEHERARDMWSREFEELDIAYGELEIQKDRLAEERDHYEERCRYLEGEIEDKEELEAKLSLAIKQRDYYYDLLEGTSEVEKRDE